MRLVCLVSLANEKGRKEDANFMVSISNQANLGLVRFKIHTMQIIVCLH